MDNRLSQLNLSHSLHPDLVTNFDKGPTTKGPGPQSVDVVPSGGQRRGHKVGSGEAHNTSSSSRSLGPALVTSHARSAGGAVDHEVSTEDFYGSLGGVLGGAEGHLGRGRVVILECRGGDVEDQGIGVECLRGGYGYGLIRGSSPLRIKLCRAVVE